MGLIALLVVVGLTLWPADGRVAGSGRLPSPVDGPPPVGASADDIADALVLLALVLRSGRGLVESLETVATRVGTPAGRQLQVVAAGLRWGLAPATAWAQVPQVWRPAGIAWVAAVEAGAAPADLLVRAAGTIRDAEERRLERAAYRAGTLLVLPLGLAFLPGFVCTTVVPVLLHLMARYAGGT